VIVNPNNLFGTSRLIVAAHPDDEVIGIGGQLGRLTSTSVVHVTDGAPREPGAVQAAGFATPAALAEARRREAAAALALAGIGPEHIYALDTPDETAATALVDLAWRLVALLEADAVDVVVTHPYEGGHPDHDATAFAVHAARGLLLRQRDPTPTLIEMTSYHLAEGRLTPGVFLPAEDCPAVSFTLSEAERATKRRMVACHATQRQTLAMFPIDVERFRRAPRYDFTRPPHEGKVLYELFARPTMSGERWTELARAALAELRLDSAGMPVD
jgi:N-acetylglucosamine malate deacetylase 2